MTVDFKEISKIVILVELENGNAHQVLSSNEHKEFALLFLGSIDGDLKLSPQIEPVHINVLI